MSGRLDVSRETVFAIAGAIREIDDRRTRTDVAADIGDVLAAFVENFPWSAWYTACKVRGSDADKRVRHGRRG